MGEIVPGIRNKTLILLLTISYLVLVIIFEAQDATL